MLTVTSVEVAPDMRTAVVYLASLDEAAAVVLEEQRGAPAALDRDADDDEADAPKLRFQADPAIAAGTRVEELLRGLHEGESPRRPARTSRRRVDERQRPGGRRQGGGLDLARRRGAVPAASSGSAGSATPARWTPTPPACCWSGSAG